MQLRGVVLPGFGDVGVQFLQGELVDGNCIRVVREGFLGVLAAGLVGVEHELAFISGHDIVHAVFRFGGVVVCGVCMQQFSLAGDGRVLDFPRLVLHVMQLGSVCAARRGGDGDGQCDRAEQGWLPFDE